MLRDNGVPVSPTSFLRLQKALSLGLVRSLEDFYTSARCILIKSEKYFDIYDQIFAHCFQGMELSYADGVELDALARFLLDEWLRNPAEIAAAFDISQEELGKMTPEELIRYFLDRLKEQTGEHHGGNKWIGTGGTSPVGHSGYHPGAMRVGGVSRNKSAVKVALDRRYRDYSQTGLLTQAQIGEGLKRLRCMVPSGPKDVINIRKTIHETIRNAGEIEIVFDRRLVDRLKIILMIDNGGYSMDPYVEVVQTLFNYARSQFKELKIYYFHNTIYDSVWRDPQRLREPERIDDFIRKDPETRLIIVGDASMAPDELTSRSGYIRFEERSTRPSIDRLQFLSRTFRHAVWLNPRAERGWLYTTSIGMIRQIFPMFELTLEGLDKAVHHIMSRN